MNINLTVIVQIGHFLLAYQVLSRILLRPVLAQILAFDTRSKKAASKLTLVAQHVQEQLAQNSERWQQYQHNLQTSLPDMPQVWVRGDATVFESTLAVAEQTHVQETALEDVAKTVAREVLRVRA